MRKHIQRYAVWGVGLCVLGASGCGSGGPDVDSGPSHGVQRAAEETFPELPRWHKLAIVAQEEMREKGSEGEWELLTTHIIGTVETLVQGATPELAFQPCRIALPALGGIQPDFPDDTVQRAAPVKVVGQWQKLDDAINNGIRYRLYTPDWSAMVFGATLADPVHDALPTSKDDTRVVDLDRDRKPGVTLRASIGRLYMTIRGTMRLDGIFDPSQPEAGLSGTAEYQRDFVIFGDNVFGVAKRKVEETYQNSDFRPAPTTGALTPITGEPSCAAILGG